MVAQDTVARAMPAQESSFDAEKAPQEVETAAASNALRCERTLGIYENSPSASLSSRSDDYGPSKDSGSESHMETPSESSSTTSSKKLISKPILDGKTSTTILYEVIASVDDPISIKYFQVDTNMPRTRETRFKIECHLNDKLYGVGEGSSKKAAKQLASKLTLDRLLDERPHLRDDVGRVRKGFPSKKKLTTRRSKRVDMGVPDWHHHERSMPTRYGRRSSAYDAMFEAHERARLEKEFQRVNMMVRKIERLNDYLGYDGMTPYETSLLNDYPSYHDSNEIQRALLKEEFERSLYSDFHRSMRHPDTFDFMRRMQARGSNKRPAYQYETKLNVEAQEFKPENYGLAPQY